MKKILFILLSLFVMSSVGAGVIDIGTYAFPDTIWITSASIPYTATQNNTLYILDASISATVAPNGAINFSGCDTCGFISDDAAKYTITGNYTRASNPCIVRVSGSQNFAMRNIRLVAGWNQTDTFITNNVASPYRESPSLMEIINSDTIKIDSSYFYTTGYDSITAGTGIRGIMIENNDGDGPYAIDIVNDTFIVDGYGFERRDYDPQVAIGFEMPSGGQLTSKITNGSRSEYSMRVAHNYIRYNFIGLRINTLLTEGYGVVVIDSNTFDARYVNTHKSVYDYPFGDGGAIKLRGIDKFFIRGNTLTHTIDTVTMGTDTDVRVHGGSGIFIATLQNENLPVSPLSEICYNDFSTGLDTSSDHSYGIFQKFEGGCGEINIFNNNLKATAYSNSDQSECIWMMRMDSVFFYNNKFTAVTQSDAVDAFCILLRSQSLVLGEELTFTNDTLESNDYFIGISAQTSNVDGVDFINTRFTRIDTATTMSGSLYRRFVRSGVSSTFNILDVEFYNPRMAGSLVDTTSFEWAGETGEDNFAEWFAYFEIKTKDSYGNDVNAAVSIIDDYGTTIYNNSVGVDGLDSVTQKYWFNTAGSLDSSFNQFISTATYSGETIIDTFSIGANDTTITLSFTTGAPIIRRVSARNVILRNSR